MIASFRNRTRFTMLFLILAAAVGVAGLTDGENRVTVRRITKELNPAVRANAELLHQRISFELTNVTLSELAGVVSSKIGMPVLQVPEVKARFTVKAENIPAHAVLDEALAPFNFSTEPTAEGVMIVDRPVEMRKIRDRRAEEYEVRDNERIVNEERVVVRKMREKETSFDASGKLRRELTVDLDINGEKSTGKLTIEIQK